MTNDPSESESANRSETALDPVKSYFKKLVSFLVRPSESFKTVRFEKGIVSALTFALVTQWFGAAMGYLWNMNQMEKLNALFQQYGSPHVSQYLNSQMIEKVSWVVGVGGVLLDPLFTLLSLFFSAFVLFLSSKVLIPHSEDQVSFETGLKVLCYASAASLLAIIPFGGSFLSKIYMLILQVIGIREVYKIGTLRSQLIILFPLILLGLFIGLVLGALLYFFMRMVGTP